MNKTDLELATMIAVNTGDIRDVMQSLIDEVEALRELKEDPGVELVREAAEAFGNYMAERPALPEISDGGKARLRYWAGMLAQMASAMKSEAADLLADGCEEDALVAIRLQLSVEETGEWAEALASGDLVQAAKELSDISYVTDGHYLTLGLGGIKLDVFRANHAANMTKLGPDGKPMISEAGRWIKGPNYRKADVDIYHIVGKAGGAVQHPDNPKTWQI